MKTRRCTCLIMVGGLGTAPIPFDPEADVAVVAGRRKNSPTARRGNRSGRWFLYVLLCGDGTLYTGITNDLFRREAQHNRGTASRYTRSRRPVKIIYQETCRNRSYALKKELIMKSLSRKEKEEYIARHAKRLRIIPA